jgi:squalene-associated FAD-dependent desaturase
MTGRQAVVIGGGLAGITAAIALREAGIEVTLLESRGWLGGATCSFSRGELAIDNGQHVFLGCCTAYRGLLARLGMTDSVAIQDRFDVTVLTPGGSARLRRGRLPAPLHLVGALAGYALLPPIDRLRVIRVVAALRLSRPGAPGLDGQAAGDWMAARWQSAAARRRLWDLFVVSALNIPTEAASMALVAKVIKTGLLAKRDAADIGVPAIPLGRLHGEAAGRLLDRLGVTVRLGTKAVGVQPVPECGFSVLTATAGGTQARRLGGAGTVLHADGVVLAVPAWVAARLAPAQLDPGRWAELGASPIVNVHVIYDRRVTSLPFAAAVDSPVQWVFDKTRQAGLSTGQYLAVSLSAADSYIDVPTAALRTQFLPALGALFPAAREAKVRDFFVTRERRATFRQAPGSGALRPGAMTSLDGLVLAGAWTDTGWPDTMEGAVRSGLTAARQLRLELLGRAAAADRVATAGTGDPVGAQASPASAGASS